MSIRTTTGLGGNDSEKDKDGGREQLHLSGWFGWGKQISMCEVKVSKYRSMAACVRTTQVRKDKARKDKARETCIAKFHAEKRPDDVEANVSRKLRLLVLPSED